MREGLEEGSRFMRAPTELTELSRIRECAVATEGLNLD